jgi:predicted nucleotidyltransferase
MPEPTHQLDPRALAQRIAERYAVLSPVAAVVLAGSLTTGNADQRSDIDLYVYHRGVLPLNARAVIAAERGTMIELDNRVHGPTDVWINRDSGFAVDVTFRETVWIEEQIDRVLNRHEASAGYSTCFWHNVLTSQVLFDRDGWFERLQASTRRPYPEPLRTAIIAMNHPLLARAIFSYRRQVQKAVTRHDLISVNHRVAGFLASYFDVLFAFNRVPHPGEKRLVEIAIAHCPKAPPGMPEQIAALLRATASAPEHVTDHLDALVTGLDKLLAAEHLIERAVTA